VAVTAASTVTGSGKTGIEVLGLAAGVKNEGKTETVSRIKFSVPIQYPDQ